MRILRSPTHSHTALVKLILQVAPPQLLLWQNNVGCAKFDGRFVRFGRAGLPDILGIAPGGRFLAIEVKTGKGRLTPAQRRFIATASGLGAAVCVARSLSEALAFLREQARGFYDDKSDS